MQVWGRLSGSTETAFYGIPKFPTGIRITGCTPKVAPLDDRPDCPSSVEGYFHSQEWHQKERPSDVPALIVKEGYDRSALSGTAESITDEGIVFDQVQQSPTFDPEPKLYKNDEIIAYVDSSGRVVRGQLPGEEKGPLEAKLFVRPSTQQEADAKRMTLEPNQRFEFCMSPGTYTVTKLHFQHARGGKVDKAIRYGSMHLTVSPDSANYLGTLRLNADSLAEPDVYPMPVKPEKRPVSGALSGQLLGLIGSIAHEVALALNDVSAIHPLSIARDSGFAPAAPLPLNYSPLGITPNETITSKLDSIEAAAQNR